MSEKRRLDYLKECNEYAVPLDQFAEQFCNRCQQPECTRSQFGTSTFDQRVSTWLERLFTDVPRMDQTDPRFGSLQAQKFFMINPPLGSVNTSGWDVPESPQDGESPTALKEEVISPVSEATTVMEPLPREKPPLEPLAKLHPKGQEIDKVPSQTLNRNVLLMNTPSQPGKMLQGGVPLTKPTGKVAWQTPTEPNAPVVKPGGRIKLGG